MTLIDTTSAVGHILCHDMTEIIPGELKGPRFRKGHVVRAEDIPVLLRMGKEHLYVWEADDSILHEDEAAELLRALTQGEHMRASAPREGKIELSATCGGLFLADVARLKQLNGLGEISVATRFSGFPVKTGDVLCGMRVIPLAISKEKMAQVSALAGTEPLLKLLPFPHKKCGVVTTGGEVANGRIEDKFTPVLREKLAEYGCAVSAHVTLGDDPAKITAAIL
ncbi:MAG: molybdopterin-binding protein, partial [Firmicutes bacterium]|nr:molybdopterin-binding protein [Bacillota bacterium]